MNKIVTAILPFLGYIYAAQLVLAGLAATSRRAGIQVFAFLLYTVLCVCAGFRSRAYAKAMLLAIGFALILLVYHLSQYILLVVYLLSEYFFLALVLKHRAE